MNWFLVFLTILSFAIFSYFVTQTCITLGRVPYCISDTYYALDKKGESFVAVMCIQAILLIFPMLEISMSLPLKHGQSLISFLSGFWTILGTITVAMAPEFKTSEKQYKIHYWGSLVGMLGSQVYIWLICKWAYLVWVPILCWWLWTKLHHHTEKCHSWEKELFDSGDWLWWLELGIFYSLYFSILFTLL